MWEHQQEHISKLPKVTESSSKHPQKSAGRGRDELNVSSSTSASSHPSEWEQQRFRSHEDQFLMIGPGSHRDKLYNCKKVLHKHVERIVNLATHENYLTMETRKQMHQDNMVFLQELKNVGEYLAESSKIILDITTKMEIHSQSIQERNLPHPPSPQEVF